MNIAIPERSALRVTGLRKVYGTMTALENLSFTVVPGEIVGLLGPNGAGKTTTINMILGVLQPTAGSVYIDDIDLGRQRARALARTNFAAVYAPLPGNLTVGENLRFFGLLYGISALRARQLEPRDFDRFDWIVFMDETNRRDALKLSYPGARARLVRLLDFAPGQPLRDVPDPYYGQTADFAQVVGLIDTGVRGFIAALRGRQPIA